MSSRKKQSQQRETPQPRVTQRSEQRARQRRAKRDTSEPSKGKTAPLRVMPG